MSKVNANLKQDIKAYEDKYQMPSKQFYELFCAGKLDDREDFMAWAGFLELLFPLKGKPVVYLKPFDSAISGDWDAMK